MSFFSKNFFQGGLINFEKRRRVSRNLGCGFPFYFIWAWKKKMEKWRLKFLVEAEKKITHIENLSYIIVFGMLLCLIAQGPL